MLYLLDFSFLLLLLQLTQTFLFLPFTLLSWAHLFDSFLFSAFSLCFLTSCLFCLISCQSFGVLLTQTFTVLVDLVSNLQLDQHILCIFLDTDDKPTSLVNFNSFNTSGSSQASSTRGSRMLLLDIEKESEIVKASSFSYR